MLLLSIEYFERDKHNRKAPFPNQMWYYGCTKTAGKKVAKRMLPVLASFNPPDGNENEFKSINYFRDLAFLEDGQDLKTLELIANIALKEENEESAEWSDKGSAKRTIKIRKWAKIGAIKEVAH